MNLSWHVHRENEYDTPKYIMWKYKVSKQWNGLEWGSARSFSKNAAWWENVAKLNMRLLWTMMDSPECSNKLQCVFKYGISISQAIASPFKMTNYFKSGCDEQNRDAFNQGRDCTNMAIEGTEGDTPAISCWDWLSHCCKETSWDFYGNVPRSRPSHEMDSRHV